MVPVYPNKQGGYSVFTPEQGEIRLRKEFHSHIQAVEVLTATRLLLENAVGKENLERMRLD
ncbi:MAG: hypothetical protein Q8P02_01910 [Candidatus Micrarchaeota archaeon]|nr:hypothetical protein [Candidatus Micrarchaeota archaeon]